MAKMDWMEISFECVYVENEGLLLVMLAADGSITISIQYLAWEA